jgi:16S rRNA (adenine1518-N6/adenine1519-N6)-dimethyltransferase
MTTPKKILHSKGLHPIKRLGQSFLNDHNYIKKIISLLDIHPDDIVIEIGAGLGIMTEEIAKRTHKVIAIEVDPKLIRILEERLAGYQNIEIVHQDILEYDFSTAATGLTDRKVKVIGNIPYNISSQILFRLLEYRAYISLSVLMFQKELADRISAAPGSKDYGIPSVFVKAFTLCTRECIIPPHCFYPEPKVTSAVLKMIIRSEGETDLKDHNFFMTLVRLSFAMRRKTLLNNLKALCGLGYSEREINVALQQSEIDVRSRAETLSAGHFARLSNALYKAKKA